MATVEYLKSYFDEDVRLHDIYRYMDRLYSTQRDKVQQISVEHTMRILGGRIGVVFYDVTTLYFESAPDPDDELRRAGFSKDGKTAESQIVLGLLVSQDGYPMSYSIFNGSQYEGRTMIPVIDDFDRRGRFRAYEHKECGTAGVRRLPVHPRGENTERAPEDKRLDSGNRQDGREHC